MKEYFYLVTALSLLCSVGVYMCRERMRPALRCGLSLTFVLCILSPLPGLLNGTEDGWYLLPDAQDIEQTEYYELCCDAFCRGVEAAVAEKFSVSAEQVRADCRGLSLTELKCSELRITLSGGGARVDRERVKEFAQELLLPGGGVFVEYGFGD